MITLVDYGLGNIQAFYNIYKRLGIPVKIAVTTEDLNDAKKIILPGVGAFDWAMTRLNESGMREHLEELVLVENRPVLGVCVGMQIMAERSEEGTLDGLAWIAAEVRKLDEVTCVQKTHLPHMGWNDVTPRHGESLFRNLEKSARFYFLHSYHFAPDHENEAIAFTDYNGSFISSVRSRNVFGVQFHPEKSHHWGMQLLRNFGEL